MEEKHVDEFIRKLTTWQKIRLIRVLQENQRTLEEALNWLDSNEEACSDVSPAIEEEAV